MYENKIKITTQFMPKINIYIIINQTMMHTSEGFIKNYSKTTPDTFDQLPINYFGF